jgi:hypothetical protein
LTVSFKDALRGKKWKGNLGITPWQIFEKGLLIKKILLIDPLFYYINDPLTRIYQKPPVPWGFNYTCWIYLIYLTCSSSSWPLEALRRGRTEYSVCSRSFCWPSSKLLNRSSSLSSLSSHDENDINDARSNDASEFLSDISDISSISFWPIRAFHSWPSVGFGTSIDTNSDESSKLGRSRNAVGERSLDLRRLLKNIIIFLFYFWTLGRRRVICSKFICSKKLLDTKISTARHCSSRWQKYLHLLKNQKSMPYMSCRAYAFFRPKCATARIATAQQNHWKMSTARI